MKPTCRSKRPECLRRYTIGYDEGFKDGSEQLKLKLENLLTRLHDMANMPRYDQDDEHRLRHKAQLAIDECENQNVSP